MTEDRIRELRDALRADDPKAAVRRLDDYDDALERRGKREDGLRRLARGVLARTSDSDEANQIAQEFVTTHTDAEQTRIQSKLDFMLYLKGGRPAAEVADRIDTVIETTEEVEQLETALREKGTDVSIPPALAVIGPAQKDVPKGESFELSYEVENLGVSEISNLDVEIEGYDVSVSIDTIATLAPTESETLTVSGSADESTTTMLSVDVGGERVDTGLNILDKAGYLEQSLRLLDQLEEQVRELDIGDDHPGEGRGPPGDHPGEGRGPPGDRPGRGRGPPGDDEHPGRGRGNQSTSGSQDSVNHRTGTDEQPNGTDSNSDRGLLPDGGHPSPGNGPPGDDDDDDDHPGRGPPDDDDDHPGRGPPDDDDHPGEGRGPPDDERGEESTPGLLNKIETARKRIQAVIDDIESGSLDEVDDEIRDITRLMGAFINQVEGLSDQHISETDRALLSSDAARTIDMLENAITAEP